jgi:small-conductance mechanosensitive channel
MSWWVASVNDFRAERWRRRAVAALTAIAAALVLVIQAGAAGPVPDPGKKLIDFLESETGWYRQVSTFTHGEAMPEEVLLQQAVAQSAQQALQQSFLFAQNQAIAMNGGGTPTSSGGQSDRLSKLVMAVQQRVTDYRAQLDALDEQLRAGGPATSQPVVTARRDKMQSELNLAEARLEVLTELAEFASEGAGGGLSRQVEELKSSVPDAQITIAATQPAPAPSAANQAPVQISSMGILGLIEEMFSLSHKMSDVKQLAARTESLQKQLEQLRSPISSELMDAIHRADALAAEHDSNDPNVLASQRKELDTLTSRFNLLSKAAVPLREAGTYLDTTHSSLLQWHAVLQSQYYRTIRFLLTRLGIMGGLVLLVLVISSVWKRATFRYVTDIRRRRQFLFIRRLIVGGMVLVIVLGGFVTEFGSLATYAGLLTAGIAVALQSVILSGVSHFFFMGRYGVRVGDRITVSGITGDVIDIGIFRMYMMELNGEPNNLQPTGRIVVFSNSVLFQPNAFYKQIPGAEYNWHELGLTLSPDSDYRLAETRLMEAVKSVYDEYKDTIERQHEAARNMLHIQLATPQIQGRMRFVDTGVEFVVRYPVEMRRAAEIDDKITRKLLDTIEAEPRLKLVATSTPKIQAANGAVAAH